MSAPAEPAANGTRSVSAILRKQFPAEQVGKLPRVTCPECSDRRKQCDKHNKSKCQTCQSYISDQHIHLDYVGHADVTSRLLDADPEWSWEPQARDIDPAVLAAAVATGDREIVRLVLENAPPKFDADDRGAPVGLWIRLTIGGVTRPGFGSCPSGQNDAVKVLIGDSLRNAAMRFGVAVDLWAKGDRADPAAENATASAGQASRRGQRPASGDGRAPAGDDPPDLGDWGTLIDAITSQEDADKADAELREVFKAGKMSVTNANAVRGAIKAKAAHLARASARKPGDEAAGFAALVDAAQTVDELKAVFGDIKAAGKQAAAVPVEGTAITLSAYVTRRKAQLESAGAPA